MFGLASLFLAPIITSGYIIPRQTNASLACLPILTLQCCGSLDLASTPGVSNILGLEGVPLPEPYITVGLNCSGVPADGSPIQSTCLGLLSCCLDPFQGDGTIAVDCGELTVIANGLPALTPTAPVFGLPTP